jgi:hypothetical protein
MSYQELQNVATVANRIAPECYHRVAREDFTETLSRVTLGFCYVAILGLVIMLAVVK